MMKDIAAKKIIEKQRRFHISGLVQVWFKSGSSLVGEEKKRGWEKHDGRYTAEKIPRQK